MNTRLSTGLREFDTVLNGGLLRHHTYLVRGGPGAGKTTLGMHFCAAAHTARERSLFITLGQPEIRLRQDADSMSIDLSGVEFLDLTPSPQEFAAADHYDIFTPGDVDKEPTTRRIIQTIDSFKPHRVFVDAVTHFRYLANDVFQYRKQVMSLLRFLTGEQATVLVSSEASRELSDEDLQYLVDGVFELENDGLVRGVRVTKFRGSDFQAGSHGIRLRGHGIELYRTLQPEEYLRPFEPLPLPTGIAAFDAMIHGGLERGTHTYVCGPSGSGKSTLAAMIGLSAVERNERCTYFSFEENGDIFSHHLHMLGVEVDTLMREDKFAFRKVHPNDLSAEEFSHLVRHEIEELGSRQVIIDSVAGYRLSLRSHDTHAQLNALCKYLSNVGCSTVLVGERSDTRVTAAGNNSINPVELAPSYIADTVVEIVRRDSDEGTETGIRVLKKRLSSFNRLTHSFEIVPGEPIRVGLPWIPARPGGI